MRSFLRAAALSAELFIAASILAVACATAPGAEPIPAVIVRREREDPRRGGDFTYYLSAEFRDRDGVFRVERVEVTAREFIFYWEGREACVIASPGRITTLVPCRR